MLDASEGRLWYHLWNTNHFNICVTFKGALSHLPSDSTFLHASEWHVRGESSVAVYPNTASHEGLCDLRCSVDIISPDAGPKPIFRRIGPRNSVGRVAEGDDWKDRPELLLVNDAGAFCDSTQDGGRKEISLPVEGLSTSMHDGTGPWHLRQAP